MTTRCSARPVGYDQLDEPAKAAVDCYLHANPDAGLSRALYEADHVNQKLLIVRVHRGTNRRPVTG